MKLLRRKLAEVEDLARRRRARKMPAGIAWTREHTAADREPGACEHLAIDVVELRVEGLWSEWSTCDRVTSDPEDLGFVRDAAGREIGRVVGRSGDLVDVVYYAAAGG